MYERARQHVSTIEQRVSGVCVCMYVVCVCAFLLPILYVFVCVLFSFRSVAPGSLVLSINMMMTYLDTHMHTRANTC